MITSNASHSIMVTIRKPRIAIMYLNASIPLLVPAQFGLPPGLCVALGLAQLIRVHDLKFNQARDAQSSCIVRKYRYFAFCCVSGSGESYGGLATYRSADV